MMCDFSTLLEHFTLFRALGLTEQGEKVCHQGWRFTLHSQGMDAYTELLSEEGKAAIPTDPDSPASPELLPSYRDRQVLGLVPHGVCRT